MYQNYQSKGWQELLELAADALENGDAHNLADAIGLAISERDIQLSAYFGEDSAFGKKRLITRLKLPDTFRPSYKAIKHARQVRILNEHYSPEVIASLLGLTVNDVCRTLSCLV